MGPTQSFLVASGVYTIVDGQDAHLLTERRWYLSSKGYVRASGTRFLHRVIMDNPTGMVVAHRDHDKLNNTRDNLVITTHQENQQQNSFRVRRDSSSGKTGVHWGRREQKWIATITLSGRLLHLGAFRNIVDAVAAREVAERKYFNTTLLGEQ